MPHSSTDYTCECYDKPLYTHTKHAKDNELVSVLFVTIILGFILCFTEGVASPANKTQGLVLFLYYTNV